MIRIGIVGATGMVGQQFIRLLQDHPWFEISALAASSRSAGKRYEDAVAGRWKVGGEIPTAARYHTLIDATEINTLRASCDAIFCAVDLSKEETIALENSYAAVGLAVFSNNSAQRNVADVPMIIPEVNAHHLDLISVQRKKRGYDTGFVVVKPNCSLQSYVPVLGALRSFMPTKVFVTTFQAISGSGKLLEEVPEIFDNSIPLPGEESKSENEPKKILGSFIGDVIEPSSIAISAHCQRVPTSDGHLAAVSVAFEKKLTPELAVEIITNFRSEPQDLELPSAPLPCFTYFENSDRPQVKLDRNVGKGMGIAVGRMRPCNVFDLKFLALSHNTVRGAAGGALLTAELAYKKGFFNKLS